MTKKVNYKEYREALREARYELQKTANELGIVRGVELYEINMDFDPVEMGVNWSAFGTVTGDEALKFSSLLGKAVEIAISFKYNGYIVDYGD